MRNQKTFEDCLSASRQLGPAHWIASGSMFQTFLRPTLRGWLTWISTAVAIVVALLFCTTLVYQTGGTKYAYPYLILLPVILGAAVFKIPGGILTAGAAAMLLGPSMPIDVAAGSMQTTENWVVRLAIYLLIGGFAGALATALDHEHRRILALGRHDPLTGLVSPVSAGHLAASDDYRKRLGYSPSHAVAVGFDGHDRVVLALGMDVGNQVIRCLVGALAKAAGPSVLMTRMHGATFAMLLADGPGGVQRFILHCQQNLPSAINVGDVAVTMLPRFGVVRLQEEDRRRAMPFRKALVALRAAQDEARQIAFYHDELDADGRDNLSLLTDFRRDLEAGRCEVHFQPKVSLIEDRVMGAEALIRWNHADRGLIPPDRFVPVVENTTLIDQLTRFVIDRSVRALAEWRQNGLDLGVAINISVRNLEDETLVEFLTGVPRTYGVPAGSIELELTETAVMNHPELARRQLERLRDAGFTIAIDDFGTGYSSLGYLKELQVDWVKLDQSFVRDLPGNNASREITAATVAMCQRLDYKVIAEGVENGDTVGYLQDLGYDAAQGFHLAKPMPSDVFTAWLSGQPVAGLATAGD